MPPVHRHRIALAMFALLATACGGSTKTDGPDNASRTPAGAGGSSAPMASTAGEASRKGSTKAPATPAPTARPIPAEPARAVGTWLDAVAAGDYATQLNATGEGMRALMAIRRIIQLQNQADGATTTHRVEVQTAPATAEASADLARVAFKAVDRSAVAGPKGKVSDEVVLDGPATLKKLEGAWRIVDVVYDGRPIAPTYAKVDMRQTRGDVLLLVGARLSYKNTTAFLVQIANQSKSTVGIKVKGATLTAADGSSQPLRAKAFDGQDAPSGFLGFPRVEGGPKALRVELERMDGSGSWTYDFTF